MPTIQGWTVSVNHSLWCVDVSLPCLNLRPRNKIYRPGGGYDDVVGDTFTLAAICDFISLTLQSSTSPNNEHECGYARSDARSVGICRSDVFHGIVPPSEYALDLFSSDDEDGEEGVVDGEQVVTHKNTWSGLMFVT